MTFFEMFDAAKAGLKNADVSGLNGHVAIQIEVTEDGCGIFYAEVTDGVLNVQPYNYYDHTAAVTLPHSTLFALLRRETTLPEAVAQEKAFVQGCMESAAKLFAAVPAPKKEAAPAEEKKPACCKATAAETKKETACKATATPVVEAKAETTCKAAAPVVEEKKEAATTPAKATAPVVEEKNFNKNMLKLLERLLLRLLKKRKKLLPLPQLQQQPHRKPLLQQAPKSQLQSGEEDKRFSET